MVLEWSFADSEDNAATLPCVPRTRVEGGFPGPRFPVYDYSMEYMPQNDIGSCSGHYSMLDYFLSRVEGA